MMLAKSPSLSTIRNCVAGPMPAMTSAEPKCLPRANMLKAGAMGGTQDEPSPAAAIRLRADPSPDHHRHRRRIDRRGDCRRARVRGAAMKHDRMIYFVLCRYGHH